MIPDYLEFDQPELVPENFLTEEWRLRGITEIAIWKTAPCAFYVHMLEENGECWACLFRLQRFPFGLCMTRIDNEVLELRALKWCELHLSHVQIGR